MVLSVRDFHFYKNLAKRPLVTLPVGLSGLSVPVAHTQEAPAPVNNLSATGSVQGLLKLCGSKKSTESVN